ncbi:MAG: hypothetical protein ACSHX7_10240 [Luteolibacter sp.]
MEETFSVHDDHHFLREDRTLHWQRIATHISAHPDDLRIPLENITRWLELGRVHPAPLHDWRARIHAAQTSKSSFDELINFIATPNHDSERIKSCSPFVGLPIRAFSE